MKLAANARHIFSGRVIGLGMGRQAFIGGGMVALLCMQALAGPEGEQVRNGTATFSRNGMSTVIRASNNAIIDYRSFDIARHESVQFIQPSATSRVLNRVPDAINPTRIDGSLSANGIVYIVNSAGVYFGNRAVVNAAGLYAAAGQMTNSDFLNNVNHFTNLTGTVSNAGTVNAGAVALIGKHAENLGTINAERGLVTMAAGEDVFIGEVGGTFMVQVAGEGGAGSVGGTGVNNAGTINAPGGTVRLAAGDMYSLALKMPGRITARNTKLEAHGAGTAIVSGAIDASSTRAGERGGTVEVLGDRVALSGGTIDASGPGGGGTVLLGGDFQGRGDTRTASQTVVTTGSSIRADATESGDGGTVIVWADGTTRYHGSISTKGGEEGGNGGFVEVSGKRFLDFNGAVDTRGVNGNDGTLLLDPENIEIVAGVSPDDGEVGPADGDALFTDGPGADFVIGRAALESVLGNISLQASNNITVNTDLTLTNQESGELVTFQAGNDITINGEITTSGASILFSANDPGGTASGVGSININSRLSTAAVDGAVGDISLVVNGGTGAIRLGADLATDGGAINLGGPTIINAAAVLIDTEQGDNDNAGSLAFNGPISASSFGFDLTLDTSSAGAAAGNIGLPAVNGDGGGLLNDLILNAAGLTPGRIDLFGDILVDANGGDLASVSMAGSGVVLRNSILIDTEQGDDGFGGSVDFSGAPLSAFAPGFDLTIRTSAANANGGGAVTLGAVDNALGGQYINDLTIDATGSLGGGTLTLRGDVFLDNNGSDEGDFDVNGNGNIVINRLTPGELVIDTEQNDNGDGGLVDFTNNVLSAGAASQDLVIRTGSGGGGATAGAINIGGANNSGGSFLNDLRLDVTAATPSTIRLNNNISLDAFGGDPASFSVVGGGSFVISNSVTIDTEQGNDGVGGEVNFGTTAISANVFGNDLTINTGTGAGGSVGGNVALGALSNAGGAFVNDLTVNTNAATAGQLTLGGNISLDANLADFANFTVTAESIRLASSVTIDTEQGNDGSGGTVNFDVASISALGGGFDLTVSTTTSAPGSVGGAITLPAFGNAGGAFINDLQISRAGGAGGASGLLTLNGDIQLDNNAGDAGDFRVLDAGGITWTGSRSVDTESGNDGAAGVIDWRLSTLSLANTGADLTLNTATSAGGAAGGDVFLPAIGDAGGEFLRNLTVDATGSTVGGSVTFPTSIQLDGGDLTVVGAGAIALVGDTTIDTDVDGGATNAGDVSLPSTASINNPFSLTVDTTADGGGNGGLASIESTIGDTTRLTSLAISGAAINLGAAGVAGDITLTANDIDLVGGANSVQSNGLNSVLTLQPLASNVSIRVGSAGAGTLVLDAADLAAIGEFADGLIIGRSDGAALTTIGTSAFNIDTTIRQSGVGGAITIGSAAAVTTVNDSNLTLVAGSGDAGVLTQSANATVNTGAGALAIIADAISLLGSAGSLSTTGNVSLRTSTANRPIVIGDAGAASDFAIDDAEFATFNSNINSVVFGDGTASNEVTIGEIDFTAPIDISVPGVGGRITIDGNVTSSSSISFTASGSTIFLNADIITTDNSDITLNDNVVVQGDRTLSTSGPGSGGDIRITGTVNADAAGVDTLTMSAEDGDIILEAAVGDTARLGAISFSAFGSATIGGNIFVAGGDVNFNATPSILFEGTTTIDTDDLADTNDAGDILFGAASSINLINPGSLFFLATANGPGLAGDVTLGSVGDAGPNIPTEFSVGGDVVTLNGDITTGGFTAIGRATGSVVLAADVTIDNTAGADNEIIVHHVFGNHALTIAGDANSQLTLTGADVDSLALTGGVLLVSGVIETDTAQDYSGVGVIRMQGATSLIARDSDAADAPQDITTDSQNIINGAHNLTVIGNNISMAAVGDTATDPQQFFVQGAGNVTLGEISVGAATITADSDANGSGTLTVSAGNTLAVFGGNLNLTAADFVLDGVISAAASPVRIERSANGTIGVGAATGDMSISNAELSSITASALTIGGPTTSADIVVDAVAAPDLANIAGGLTLDATGAGGSVTFQNGASTFRNLTVTADDGITVDTDISTLEGDLALEADADNAADFSDALVISAGRTINSAGSLTLDATTGGIDGAGGVVLAAVNGVTINDSVDSGGSLTINADADANGVGAATLAAGATITTGNADLSITAADLLLDGSVAAGSGAVTITRADLGAIRLGGTAQAGELHVDGAELERIAAVGLNVGGATATTIFVDGITTAQSDGITGVTSLNALANGGEIQFINAASQFNTLSVNADNRIAIDQDLSTVVGDLLLNSNVDVEDDDSDRVVIAQGVNLSSAHDLRIVGAGITLTGAAGSTNTFTSLNEGNVSLSNVGAPSSANLTVTSQNDVFLSSVQLNTGDLVATADSNSNGPSSLSVVDINANSATLSGGTDVNDTIAILLSANTPGGFTARNALAVNINGGVSITTNTGAINFSDNVASVVLLGADATTVSLTSTTGEINFAPIVADNDSNLIITTGGNAVFTAIDLNEGDLVVNADIATANSIQIDANDVALNNAITTTAGGTLTINNSGVLTLPGAEAISLDGAFTQSGTGTTNLGGSITTTGDTIAFTGPVVLTSDATLSTGAGAGDINFLSTVSSDSDTTRRSLTLNAGTGSITAGAGVGQNAGLNTLLIETVNNATFSGAVTANTIRQAAGTGTSTFADSLSAEGASGIDLDGNAFVFQGPVVTTTAGAGFSLTNATTANFQSTSNIVIGGAFLQDGAGPVTLSAHLSTSGAPISFSGPVTVPAEITISNSGAGNITFGSTLTTTAPVRIEGGAAGSGNVSFNGSVTTTGEFIVRTGTGAVTFTNAVVSNSALTVATTAGAITFSGPLSVIGALSASAATTGNISFANTVSAGSVFAASTNSGNITFGGIVNGTSSGNGIFFLNAGIGDIIFNSGATVGVTNRIQSFTANARNITVRTIVTQGTAASGDGDINLTPDLSVTENEIPNQAETDNRPNGLLRILGDIVANNGNINISAAGRQGIPSVASIIIGDQNIANGASLPTFTLAANTGDLVIGEFEKVVAFGDLSIVGRNITVGDVVALGGLALNAGDNITLRQRERALLLKPTADGAGFITDQIDFGTNIVGRNGVAFTADNVFTTGTGARPSIAIVNGQGVGVPGEFPVALRNDFNASALRVGTVALSIDANGTTNTGLATALAGAIPRDTEIDTFTEGSSLGQAEKEQLREIRINMRDLAESEMLDFLSGRSLYEDVVLDPDAVSEDYLISVNRLPSSQVARVLEVYREVFKSPRIDPDTGEQMVDETDGRPLFDDRDREIRDDLAASLRRFRKEGRDGTIDPVEFRRYLESTPEESATLAHIESLQRFFEELHLLGLGPREEENSKRTLLGRIKPNELRVSELADVIAVEEEGLRID